MKKMKPTKIDVARQLACTRLLHRLEEPEVSRVGDIVVNEQCEARWVGPSQIGKVSTMPGLFFYRLEYGRYQNDFD